MASRSATVSGSPRSTPEISAPILGWSFRTRAFDRTCSTTPMASLQSPPILLQRETLVTLGGDRLAPVDIAIDTAEIGHHDAAAVVVEMGHEIAALVAE